MLHVESAIVMKRQDMNLTPDRQGYLGDLMYKSIPQLKELLERQEKILLKGKFLESLQDKGERIKAFADNLKQLIELKSRGLPSSSAYTDVSKGIPTLYEKSNPTQIISVNDIRNKEMLDFVVSRDDLNIETLHDIENNKATSETSQAAMLNSDASLVTSLEKMSLSSCSHQESPADTEHYINSYERVIKNVATTSSNRKPKFLPHRTLHDDHIPVSPYVHNTRSTKTERMEESAVNPPKYKFQNSKLISIEESVKIIEQQRVLNEELITQRAAKKLADQLLPKMDIYSPAGTDMQYREHSNTDQDSDDDEDDDANQDGEY